MPEILFRWNYYTEDWEVYSLSLQSWQPSSSLRSNMTEKEVRDYYQAYGHEARKRTPVTYEQGRAEVFQTFYPSGRMKCDSVPETAKKRV